MKLLDFPAAPNPRRVRIYVAEKGLDLEIETVDVRSGANRTPEFLAKSPFGHLPVLLLDDGSALTESMAICRYLEELHPDPPLFGRDALERARVEMWSRRMEFELFRNVGDYFRHHAPFFAERYAQSPEVGRDGQRLCLERLAWLDGDLADGRPFLAGDAFSVADITGWVSIDLGVPSVFRLDDFPNVARWFDAIGSRPSTRA